MHPLDVLFLECLIKFSIIKKDGRLLGQKFGIILMSQIKTDDNSIAMCMEILVDRVMERVHVPRVFVA